MAKHSLGQRVMFEPQGVVLGNGDAALQDFIDGSILTTRSFVHDTAASFWLTNDSNDQGLEGRLP